MIHHGGAIDGFASQVAFLPEEQIGVVVLCNTNGSILPYTISFNVIDRLLELEPVDWSGRLAKLVTGDSTDSEAATDTIETPTTLETSVEEKPVETQVHPHDRPIHAYAGSYNHPGYGEIVIQQTNDGLQATLNAIEMPMEYTGKDTFSVELVLFGLKITFTFKTDEEDTISSLSIPLLLEPGTNPIEFIKTPSV